MLAQQAWGQGRSADECSGTRGSTRPWWVSWAVIIVVFAVCRGLARNEFIVPIGNTDEAAGTAQRRGRCALTSEYGVGTLSLKSARLTGLRKKLLLGCKVAVHSH